MVAAESVHRVEDDGVEPDHGGDINWRNDSWMECEACEYAGTVKNFDVYEEVTAGTLDEPVTTEPPTVEAMATRGWPVHRTQSP